MNMLNFGPINFISSTFMMPFLEFSYHSLIPNYGVAIILLTLVIKVAFMPLMNKQFASMKKMKELTPEMTKLREKYKSEPQKLHQETLKLYKENKVNPFAGCLPILVQMPFFLAIYATILSDKFTSILASPGVNHGLFPFWLADLSAPDATFILPVVLAWFTYWSQKMVAVDPQQQKFLFIGPVMILAFGFKLPSGALLYWAVSTVVTALHQMWILKQDNNQMALEKAK